MRCPVRDPENKSSIAVFYSRPIYAKIPLLCSQTDKHENCLRMIYIALLSSRLRPTNPHNIHRRGWCAPPVGFNKLNTLYFYFFQGYDVTNYTHYMCLHCVTGYFVSNHVFPARASSEILCLSMSSSCCGTAKHPFSTSSPPNSLGLAVEKSLAVQRQNKVRVGLAVVSYPPRLPRVTAVLVNPL